MRNILLALCAFMATTGFTQGQGDVTFYSNTGAKFYVVLNGVRQNQQPETNVKVTGLNNQWYDAKLIAADKSFEVDKNIIVKYDTLITYELKEKRGKYKLRYYSETPMGTATAVTNQTVVSYHPTENTNTTTTNTNSGVNNSGTVNQNTNVNTSGNQSTTVSTTTTTTGTTTNTGTNGASTNTNVNGNGESINMNVSVNENGANVNVSTSGTANNNGNVTMTTDVNGSTSTNTSTSTNVNGSTYEETTTTTTTSNSGNGTTYYEETTTTTTTTTSGGNQQQGNLYQDDDMTVTMETNNSCYISDTEVDELVDQVANEAFADDQQRVANAAAKNKCMSVEQIKRVAQQFDFADNKMSFVKAAYDNCTDKGNYYQLMEIFDFSSDKEELETFINTK